MYDDITTCTSNVSEVGSPRRRLSSLDTCEGNEGFWLDTPGEELACGPDAPF